MLPRPGGPPGPSDPVHVPPDRLPELRAAVRAFAARPDAARFAEVRRLLDEAAAEARDDGALPL